jgi:cobalamin biosynthesis protein CobT
LCWKNGSLNAVHGAAFKSSSPTAGNDRNSMSYATECRVPVGWQSDRPGFRADRKARDRRRSRGRGVSSTLRRRSKRSRGHSSEPRAPDMQRQWNAAHDAVTQGYARSRGSAYHLAWSSSHGRPGSMAWLVRAAHACAVRGERTTGA